MKKYKNIGGRNIGFLINGKTYDFVNGEVVELPDNFQEEIAKIVPLEKVPEKLLPPKEVKMELEEKLKESGFKKEPKKKLLTKTAAINMKKDGQVKLLKELGAKKIPRLEKDRVKLILKLQGEEK